MSRSKKDSLAEAKKLLKTVSFEDIKIAETLIRVSPKESSHKRVPP